MISNLYLQDLLKLSYYTVIWNFTYSFLINLKIKTFSTESLVGMVMIHAYCCTVICTYEQ